MALLLLKVFLSLYVLTGSVKAAFMKANTREAELLDGVELEEPHFDEEATVLSARPVVPLEVVEKKERSGKRWAFAAVIVVALLIGAFSAALIYKLRDAEPSTVAQEERFVQPPVRTLEAGVGASVAETPSANKPQVEEAVAKIPAKAPVSTVREPVAVSRNGRQNRADDDREERIAEERELQKENRRADKLERRRQRRAERQAQRNGDSRSDDLLRIREIFEGAPRP